MFSQKGITIVDALFLTSVIGMLTGSLVYMVHFREGVVNGGYEDDARHWALDLGMDVVEVKCVNKSSMPMVPCTLTVRKQDDVHAIPIECASNWSQEQGCQMKVPVLY